MRRGCVSPSMSKGSMTPATGRTQTSLVMVDDGSVNLIQSNLVEYLSNLFDIWCEGHLFIYYYELSILSVSK